MYIWRDILAARMNDERGSLFVASQSGTEYFGLQPGSSPLFSCSLLMDAQTGNNELHWVSTAVLLEKSPG
jgi:hypothetical protein